MYLVTADVTEHVRKVARDAGMAGILFKPVKADELESVLKRLSP